MPTLQALAYFLNSKWFAKIKYNYLNYYNFVGLFKVVVFEFCKPEQVIAAG